MYSRKHGDLERDYNFFTVAPTFYSQGNGNYRDVNQNRRNDVWFNTDVKESHIVNFLNLSQADGYNPLVVKGTSFVVKSKKQAKSLVDKYVKSGDTKGLEEFLLTPFLPGSLLNFIDSKGIKIKGNVKEFLGEVLESSQMQELADHGEGFWSDHWTYNLDLIESFLALYPDRLEELLLKTKSFHFYLNHHYVKPREQRYHLTQYGVRQYNSVFDDSQNFDPSEYGFKLREKDGEGAVYSTNLTCKLLCLIANKVASLDPSGIGIELEADKPNWYDALNGLPGLLGSAISETLELNRYASFLLESFKQLSISDEQRIPIYEELATFVSGLTNILTVNHKPLDYWNKSNDVKEKLSITCKTLPRWD